MPKLRAAKKVQKSKPKVSSEMKPTTTEADMEAVEEAPLESALPQLSRQGKLVNQTLSHSNIMALQRAIGNQAVGRILAGKVQRQPITKASLKPPTPAPSVNTTHIQRLTTDKVDDRVLFMQGGLNGWLAAKAIADNWKAIIRTKFEAAVRQIFTTKAGTNDKDSMYAPLTAKTKLLLTAYETANGALTKYNNIGGDFGKTDIKDLKKALVDAMTDGTEVEPITNNATALEAIVNNDAYSPRKSLGQRMGAARGKEVQYEAYKANPQPTEQETRTLGELKTALDSAKGSVEGVANPLIEALDPFLEKLRKYAEITVFAAQLKQNYMAAPFLLPEEKANAILAKRHREYKSTYKTKASIKEEFKSELKDWRETKEGNESTTKVPAITDDESADFAPGLKKHLFQGNVNWKGEGSGVHFKSALDANSARITGIREELTGGFYKAKVEVLKGAEWKLKPEKSTFFPDGWTEQNVLEQITIAWNSVPLAVKNALVDGSKWEGTANGVTYQGYVNGAGNVTAAWPQVAPAADPLE